MFQVWFDAALEGFIGLAGDESFAGDAVAVNNVGDEVRDIGLDVEADKVGISIDAASDEGHGGRIL